jgi:hypothetical protein
VAKESLPAPRFNSKAVPVLEHTGLVEEEGPPALEVELMVDRASRQQSLATTLSTGQAVRVETAMASVLLIPAAVSVRMEPPTGVAEGRMYRQVWGTRGAVRVS